MFFRNAAALAAVAVALGVAHTASATYYTTNATVEVYNPTLGPPPINDVYQITFQQSGKAYTNQWSGAGPNAPGAEIRTITVQTVTGALNNVGDFTPAYVDRNPGAGVSPAQLIIISAVKGTVFAGGGTSNPALFTQGMAFATYRAGATGATAINPTTFSFANTFSQYTLVNDSIQTGFPFDDQKSLDFNINAATSPPAAGQVNTSAPNTAILGGFAYFLFKESSTRAQNAAAGPDGSGFFGDDFIRNYEVPSGYKGISEGIVSEIIQTVDPVKGYSSLLATYKAQLAVFNTIWAAAFPGEVWATNVITSGGAGAATTWDPLHATSGDFRANVGGRLAPAVEATAVPEPGSLALLAMGFVGLVGYRVRRSKVK